MSSSTLASELETLMIENVKIEIPVIGIFIVILAELVVMLVIEASKFNTIWFDRKPLNINADLLRLFTWSTNGQVY